MADMPLPVWKATLFFEDYSVSYGWSETYYILTGDTVTVPQALADALISPRKAFLPTNHSLIAGRLSQEGVSGDAGGINGAPVAGDIDETMRKLVDRWSCLLLAKGSGDRRSHGHTFCHAVPQDMFTAGDNYNAMNASDMAVQAFCTLLTTGPYAMRSKRLGVVTYPAIVSCAPRRKTEHKIGRPFGLRRGRASRV